MVEFGGLVVDPGALGIVPGFGAVGLGVELPDGIVPGVGTHGPFAGTGTGVVDGALPGVPGSGVDVGVPGVVCGGGVLWVPSPAALVVIGVGGPIGFVGGVIVGLVGVCVPLGVAAGAVGVVVCCGAVVVVGAVGGAGGVAARVRCAAAQLPQPSNVISRISCFDMGFALVENNTTAQRASCWGVLSQVSNSQDWRAIRRIP